ncbi:MAG: hypothetical protein ACLQDY_24570 [Streptosporangiaceae bacterium]
MGANTFRYHGEVQGSVVYWRRRFAALVIGLAVFAVIAWGFSDALGSGATAGGGSPGAAAGNGQHGQAGGGRGGAGGSPVRPPAATGSRSDSASPSPSAAAGSGPARSSAAASPGGRTASTVTCPRKDVVLSLAPSQSSSGPRGVQEFSVDVVSTFPRTCTLNVGTRYLTLTVTSGRARVWDSADCVQGQGSLVIQLQRGVPTSLPVAWDQQRSARGCPAGEPQAASGLYTATATDGLLTSNALTFRLR